jgi:hypothetical protein
MVTATAHTPSGPFPLRVTSGSPQGLWIVDAPVLPSAFAFHLTLALPDGPLEAIAMVLRSTPDGTAARLTLPHAHDRERWRAHLRGVPVDLSIGDLEVLGDPRDLFDFNWSNEDTDDADRSGSADPFTDR